MLNSKFSPWPSYSAGEAEAVARVLLSNKVNYWTGKEAREFECEFAGFADCRYAVALANGTVALDLALLGLGIGKGDEVIVTPRTFIASVSSVVNCGAIPVFADIDENTQGLCARTIEPVITSKSKAIVVVHLAGVPVDMDPIMELAKKNDLKVIEDCAQAHGARYKGKSVGSIGHVAAWSFCQDKIMSTGGEGGMVTTNDKTLWNAMWSYKDHGKSWQAVYEKDHPPGYRWLHESFGTNWRMTEVQAVLGRIQLERMPRWQRIREANTERIWNTCRECDWLRVPVVPKGCRNAAYKAYVFVRSEKLPIGWSRDAVLDAINEYGVPVFPGTCSEVYLEKAFDDTGWRPQARLPVASELGSTAVMFMVHPTLTNKEIEKTCAAILRVNQLIGQGRKQDKNTRE